MPYSPGQPWDQGLSYLPGQTCTYNGYPYVWYHPTLNSTIGVKPNEEEVMFEAVYPGGFTDQRLERGWVMANHSQTIGGGAISARYGDVKSIQRSIRMIPDFVDTLNLCPEFKFESGIYPAFWAIGSDNKWDDSWEFYGYSGMSLDSGLENNAVTPPVPSTEGNPNVNALSYFEMETYGPEIYSPPSLPYAVLNPTGPTTADIKVYYTIAENQLYAPNFINQFGREASYKIVVNPAGGGPPYEINDSINSGLFRDGFSLQANSNVNTHPVATGVGFSFTFKVTGLTPRFDA